MLPSEHLKEIVLSSLLRNVHQGDRLPLPAVPPLRLCAVNAALRSPSPSLRQPGSLGNVEDVPASPPATHRGSVRAALSAFNASSRDFCQTRTSSILFAHCHALDFPKVDGRASANCGHRVLTAPHRRPWGTRDAP